MAALLCHRLVDIVALVVDEQALYRQLRSQLMQVGEDARCLVASLHRALAGAPPFWLPLPALQALSRRLIADEALCDELAIPRRPAWSVACVLASGGVAIAEWRLALPALRQRAAARGERFFSRVVAQGLEERDADFHYREAATDAKSGDATRAA